MFVLERNRENITTETIQEDTKVQLGFPSHPIAGAHKEQLVNAFRNNKNIKEVYHFIMLHKQETIYILAFVLDTYTDNAQMAVMDNINDGMKGHQLDLPLDIMYIQKQDDWYTTVQQFEIFYKG